MPITCTSKCGSGRPAVDLGVADNTPVRGGQAIRYNFPGVPADVVGVSSLDDAHWLVDADGAVEGRDGAAGRGGTETTRLNGAVVAIDRTPSGGGYWLVAADGGVFAFGDAPGLDPALGHQLSAIAAHPGGRGAWLVTVAGHVMPRGEGVADLGSAPAALRAPIVDIEATPSGQGYWLVGADGGVFRYGDAEFFGSAGDVHLNAPVVGMAATWDGRGYWLAATDGGVFNFGNAPFVDAWRGNPEPIMGIARMQGKGYRLVDAAGASRPFPA